ncbi:MAG: ABC transporter substrate-binding protein [Planctomycetes bacterium]|nr:ABC transporter substrate-binding protein [Planctomycetota bacterium]
MRAIGKDQAGYVVLAVLMVLGLWGCSKRHEADAMETSSQTRIVSLAPNLTEILFALGLEDEIVGVTRHCNYPPSARQKRQVGTFWQPDIEAVLAQRPTLVVTLGFEQQRQVALRLERIGCATLTLEIDTVDQLYESILTLGRALARNEQAQALVARLSDAQRQWRQRKPAVSPPKVLWVVQREPLRVAGTKTFINELVKTVGGVNAIGPTLHFYPPISAEQVLAAQPDVIIEPTDEPAHLDDQRRLAEGFYAAYRSVPAVRNGRIYIVDGDVVSRLGPRLDEALEHIARCVWQE